MGLPFLQGAALAMIKSQGQAVMLTPPGGDYDLATSTFEQSADPISTIGVLLPLSRGLTHMAGTDIQSGDMQLLLPGDIDQPPVDTKAVIGDKTYTISEVNPVSSGATPVYFDCIVRAPQ